MCNVKGVLSFTPNYVFTLNERIKINNDKQTHFRYINAVQNIPRVGRYLARFLIFLIENGADLNRIHMIGFSLGADVASFAGRTLIEWKYKLPRITGVYVYNVCIFDSE